MTNPNHTDTSRSVTTLTAPTLSVVGNFVPPNAVVFFDGDSVIRVNRNGTLELGPKWADAGDAAAAFFNELVSRVVPSWNARIEALEAENERLASFIMHCIEGEPSQSQGAVDTAIRIMTEQATTIGEQLAEVGQLREALTQIARLRTDLRGDFSLGSKQSDIARAALGEKQ